MLESLMYRAECAEREFTQEVPASGILPAKSRVSEAWGPGLQPKRKKAGRRAAKPEDLLAPGVQESLKALATKMRREIPSLRAHEIEDLIQAATLHVLERLHQFAGRSLFRTWVCALARNKFVDLSRRAAIRPTPAGDATETCAAANERTSPLLRDIALDLVSWLKDEGREEIPRGAEVVTLLINSGGNWDYVSQAMTTWTGEPWTVSAVKTQINRIKRTDKGRSFCESLGAPTDSENDDEEDAS